MADSLTAAEERAVAALLRLAESWPRTLTLGSIGGSLVVLRSGAYLDDAGGICEDAVVADVSGIPNTGGDW